MASYSKDFIEHMVASDVLTFGDFITKSGRETPYFINTGKYRTGAQIAALAGFYADRIEQYLESSSQEVTALFGPAYKGIPLAVATSAELSRRGVELSYTFNRKEEKDHGEGGVLVGHIPTAGDRYIIVEDVTTAGTSIRETLPLLTATGGVEVIALVVAVDRCERGTTGISALKQIEQTYAMDTVSITNAHEILEHLHGRELNGVVHVDDHIAQAMTKYLEKWAATQ